MQMKILAIAIALVSACTGAVPLAKPEHRRGGELMIEVGVRFAHASREAAAGSWELATYDLHELREAFEDDLLTKTWADNPTMKHEASGFLAGPLAQLEATARTRDEGTWASSFAATTKGCNACHTAGHVAFIVIGSEGVLRLAP